jgi:hypothetical protein
MTSNQEQEDLRVFEMEIKLPKIITGPIQLEDGSNLQVGDKVKHSIFGIGIVVRFSFSEKLGNLVYIDFESGKDEIVGASYVTKV